MRVTDCEKLILSWRALDCASTATKMKNKTVSFSSVIQFKIPVIPILISHLVFFRKQRTRVHTLWSALGDSILLQLQPSLLFTMVQESTVEALEKAYRNALALFKANKTNKDLRRARTAAKRAWDEAVVKECLEQGDEGAQQLNCRDCSRMFLWTTQEQEYYKAAERDWRHKPQRCRTCAESQKARRKSAETSEETKKKGKAGKNMCYAFQRGECPYGDLCKFNHDPEFAGKKKEENESDAKTNDGEGGESTKKRKMIPDVIAFCKWGKKCKIKRCRYRHDIDVTGDVATTFESALTTKPIHEQIKNNSDGNKATDETTAVTCIPVTVTNKSIKSSTAKKPKLLGICKWGKNCKIKRCRFEHPDDIPPSSASMPVEKDKTECEDSSRSNATGTSKKTVDSSIDAKTKTENIEKEKPKTAAKSSAKIAHKAMKKALKKAPEKKLRVKDLRKLVQKKMEDIGKDDVKVVVKKTIASNKDSMMLVDDGTFVKLLV